MLFILQLLGTARCIKITSMVTDVAEKSILLWYSSAMAVGERPTTALPFDTLKKYTHTALQIYSIIDGHGVYL